MSTEYSIICDTCSRIIAASAALERARADAKVVGAVRVGRPPRDVCPQCWGD